MGITAAAAAAKSSDSTEFILLIVVVFVGLYFLMIRPQRRRQQQAVQQQKTVSPGATVRTTAGMYATVVEADDTDVVLEIAPGVNVRYMRRAIMEVISSGEEVPESPEYAADDVTSAEDGLADSHDSDTHDGDLASSNGSKAKSDSDAF